MRFPSSAMRMMRVLRALTVENSPATYRALKETISDTIKVMVTIVKIIVYSEVPAPSCYRGVSYHNAPDSAMCQLTSN